MSVNNTGRGNNSELHSDPLSAFSRSSPLPPAHLEGLLGVWRHGQCRARHLVLHHPRLVRSCTATHTHSLVGRAAEAAAALYYAPPVLGGCPPGSLHCSTVQPRHCPWPKRFPLRSNARRQPRDSQPAPPAQLGSSKGTRRGALLGGLCACTCCRRQRAGHKNPRRCFCPCIC